MTRDESIEAIVHEALAHCRNKCQGILSINRLKQTEELCPEVHGELAKTYKGRVILQPFFSKKEVQMLCWKCLQKEEGKKSIRKTKGKKTDPNQIDAFSMPDQKKYTGPKNVPQPSKSTYAEVKEGLKAGAMKAFNLVKKSPNKTSYELLSMCQTGSFENIYDLRRHLSYWKDQKKMFNPLERYCTVLLKKGKKRKIFTWRLGSGK